MKRIKEATATIQTGISWIVDIASAATQVSSSLGLIKESDVKRLKMVQTVLNMVQGTSNRQESLDLLVDQIRPMIEAYKEGFWATAQVAFQTLQEHKEAKAAMGGMGGGYGRERWCLGVRDVRLSPRAEASASMIKRRTGAHNFE
jgi:hypothetical protein